MTSMKRAFLHIKRKKGKTVLFFTAVFLLSTFLSLAISGRSSIFSLEERIMMQVPAISALHFDWEAAAVAHETTFVERSIFAQNRPTVEEIAAVGNLNYVRAYDFFLHAQLFSRELDWAIMEIDESIANRISPFESIEQAQNNHVFWSGGEIETFPVRGIYNTDLTDMEMGLISIFDGRVFYEEEIEQGEQVVMVSQLFATQNNLQVGDFLTLHSAEHDIDAMLAEEIFMFSHGWLEERFMVYHQAITFEIVGLFQVEQEIDEERSELFGHIQNLAHLHNRIYMPVTALDSILRSLHEGTEEYHARWSETHVTGSWRGEGEEPQLEAVFLLRDSRDLGRFREAAQDLLPDFWIVADTTPAVGGVISAMDTLLSLGDYLLWGAGIGTLVTLFLIIILTLRERQQELAIYMALGSKKREIASQILIEVLTVSSVAMVLALFTGNMLSRTISRNLLEQTMLEQVAVVHYTNDIPSDLHLFNPSYIPLEEIMDMYDTSMTLSTTLIFLGISAGVILVAVILPVFKVVHRNPKSALLVDV